ncbi:transcriptional regulator [Streptomyces sp. NPDC088729]|uniref:transcriptional regulator n=1 Tax=Streptomyces sp. NPDC088729 TaxID=3365876 RepID=UPI0037FFCAE2
MASRPRTERHPNELLSGWLDRLGMSNVETAAAVTRCARAAGVSRITPHEGRVRGWRSGEMPRHPLPQFIVEAVSERAGTPLSHADLGLPGAPAQPSGLSLPWRPDPTIQALLHLTRSEAMREHTRHSESAAQVHRGNALLEPLQRWATITAPAPLTAPAGRAGAHVGTADVENLRAVTAMYRDIDNRHGGVLSRRAVVTQLNSGVFMPKTGIYTEAVGRELFSAVADLGSVAGWMSFDAGHHRSAQEIFIVSLHAASEGGDKALGAHILQCMARQMSHLERYEDAVALVNLAQYGARRRLSPATASMLASLEARFEALLGRHDDSDRAAGRAEDLFAGIAPADEPAHMAFFDRAELCATLGMAQQIAARGSDGADRRRRAGKSTALIHRALDARPDHRIRSKAFDHLGLARTHLAAGEAEGAQQETVRALDLFGSISSHRVGDRLMELHAEAAPFGESAPAVDLRERITDAVR